MPANHSPGKKPWLIPSVNVQVLFVALAFVLMVAASSIYVSNMLQNSLRRESMDLLGRTRLQVEAALEESKSILLLVSGSVRHKILHGADRYDVQEFIADIADMLEHQLGKKWSCCLYGYFDVFDGIYLHASREPLEGYEPRERPWFRAAMEADGEIIVTKVYKSYRTGDNVVTHVQRIFDGDGLPLGIVGRDVPMERILDYVACMRRLTPGSYGMLFDENMNILWHPVYDLIGSNALETNDDEMRRFAKKVYDGEALFEFEQTNYRGMLTVMFSEQLANGWHLFVVTPRSEYYQTLLRMVLILVGLGTVLALTLIVVLVQVDKARKRSLAENLDKDILLATMEKEKEMDRRTQLMLDAMPLCCILWDKNLNVLYCNEETVRLFKLSRKEDFTENFFTFSPEFQPDGKNSKNETRRKLLEAFESGYERFEWEHWTLDNEQLPCEVTLVRVKHMGEFIVMAYTRSLRELKATIDEMREVERNLRLAHKVAESANRAKSEFIANMSHEIRTPMNSVVGFSELALGEYAPPNTRWYLTHIKESAKDLLQIINDILDISKIESGRMEMEIIPFDLSEVLARCQTVIMPKAMEKGITVHFHEEPAVGKTLLGDPTKLRQILINFLSNAVKFTNQGMVKFMASIVESNDATIEIHFEIRDSGIGMTPEQIALVYEPFAQADSSTTRKYGGTGLGLTIAKSLIELMGSELIVESTYNIGSKFSFNLTFGISNNPEDQIVSKPVVSEIEKPVFDGEVLICEDNVLNQQVIHQHLTRVGLRTVIAANGKEAVDIVCKRMETGKTPLELTFGKDQRPFDLIFMDIHMPEMDGLEATSRITALGLQTPIIAMTANIMTSDKELYQSIGMQDCIGKPFTSQELWQCLLNYITPVDKKTVSRNSQDEADEHLKKMLQTQFLKQYSANGTGIAAAIEANDMELAHRMVHTLKSNAGQLGKSGLQKTASNIEIILREGKTSVTEKQLSDLETELKEALKEFAAMAEKPEETAAQEAMNTEDALKLAKKLEPMLKSGNTESLGLINQIRAIPGSETLILQMENFDFELALVTLIELKKEWTRK